MEKLVRDAGQVGQPAAEDEQIRLREEGAHRSGGAGRIRIRHQERARIAGSHERLAGGSEAGLSAHLLLVEEAIRVSKQISGLH